VNYKLSIFIGLWANLAGAQPSGLDGLNLMPQPAQCRPLAGMFVFSPQTAF
jgi:hypothetical protein